MSTRKKSGPKKHAPPAKYDRDLASLTDAYLKLFPDKKPTLRDLALWMISTDQWDQGEGSAVRELMRHLQKALSRAMIHDDETGKSVRKYHALANENSQAKLWAAMGDDIPPEKMKGSAQSRSNGAFGIVRQIDTDLGYFNRKHNPGDPIRLSFDFDARLEDEKHSSLFVDQPPPDNEDETA